MTERELIRDVEFQHPQTADEILVTTRPIREPALPDAAPQYVTRTVVVMPVDRVRWAAVLTGLLAALMTLTLLSLLGLAIGLTTVTPSITGTLSLDAGIWSAIGALIAFTVGGWAAARTAAVAGRANGALNGAMVWLVTIPVVFYLLGSGMATLAAMAGSTMITDAQALVGQNLSANAPTLINTGSIAAWGTLLALLLGLVAATLGGLLGARSVTDMSTLWMSPSESITLH